MKNRDYFTRPTQAGGRTAHDYGHTRLQPDTPEATPMWALGLIGAGIALMLVLI